MVEAYPIVNEEKALSLLVTDSFYAYGAPVLLFTLGVIRRSGLFLALAALILFPAISLAQNVSVEAKTTFSSDDEQKLEQASQLLAAGFNLYAADNYIAAEPLFAETLRLTREVLGDKNPLTLASLAGYADVLQNLGRASEAEPLFAEVLRLRHEVLGERHPDTFQSLSDYASVLQDLGRASEAEPLYAEALKLSQDVLGDKHPFTLLCLNQHASVLQSLGRDTEAEPLFAEGLRIRRELLGEKHFDTLGSLSGHANILFSLGRASEAEPLLAEALRLRREVLGEKHPDTLTNLNNYASVLQALGRAGEAEPLNAEALRLRREVLGEKHPDTLTSLSNYASVLQALGRSGEAEPLDAEALRLRREVLGEKHPDTLTSLSNYASVLQALGRAGEAEPLNAEVLRLRRAVLGEKHPDTLNSLNNSAFVLEALGRSEKAEVLYAEALQLSREVLGEKHANTISSLSNYAGTLNALGRGKEAEPLYAEALRLRREVLGEKHPDTIAGLSNYAGVLDALGRAEEAALLYAEALQLSREVLGEKHPDTLTILNNYAVELGELGRDNEAEPLQAQVLRLRRDLLGQKHPDTIHSLSNYAVALDILGRVDEAEPLYAEALQLNREVLGEKHPETLNSLNNYAFILQSLGRTGEAKLLHTEALRLKREVLGEKHPETLTSLNNYASVLNALSRGKEAELLYAEALRLSREVLGEQHPFTLRSMNNLAHTRLAKPSRAHLAVEPARSLITNIRAARKVVGSTPSEEAQLGREEKNQSSSFKLFANAAWSRGPGLVEEALATGAEPLDATAQARLREEVLTALQDASAGAAGKAISANVARKAAGPLEPLAVEREDLSQEWIETEKALIKTLGESDSASDEKRRNLRERLAALEARMKTIDDRLRNEAPKYFALIRPEALALSAAQKVLESDEAALMIVPTPYGTHVMLVSDEGLRWVRSDWGNDKVDALVKRLLWDVGANVDVNAAKWVEWSEEGRGALPFSFEASYALYRELIAPIGDGLKGKKHVFLSASGSLSSLPFGLLVSQVPEGDSGDPNVLRSAKWFADAHAITVIPSLQSLEFLRKYRASDGETANTPFLGIGDPVLTGQPEARGNRRSNRGVANGRGAFKRVFSGSPTRNGASIANVSELRKMARLPGTATELTAMWEAFGRPANALHLADQATEDFVRTQNLDANIIAFATHGLLAGDISGTAEPGIVLTPPLHASESDDGYLSASEISALKLNADWVILSACNTAAGDGSEGAPGLSGLARSFFYAGARNLLASHWPVRDDVAAKLTVRTISIARDNPQLSRAQAFQQAMRETRNDKSADSDADTWAHPSAWAPFSLIGGGAK